MPVSRSQLSAAVKGLPIWEEVSKEYRTAVGGTDYAKCLADLMARGAAGRDAYRRCAQTAGISGKLKAVWGD